MMLRSSQTEYRVHIGGRPIDTIEASDDEAAAIAFSKLLELDAELAAMSDNVPVFIVGPDGVCWSSDLGYFRRR